MSDVSNMITVLAGFLQQRNELLSTAESCTGGLIGHLLTNEAGSSAWYLGGVVSYSNSMKTGMLGVGRDIFTKHGAVSSQCVLAMAAGVLKLTGSHAGIAVSGIAGPDGGTSEKPVGTVFIAWGAGSDFWWEKHFFQGSRTEIKTLTASRAIQGLLGYYQNIRRKDSA